MTEVIEQVQLLFEGCMMAKGLEFNVWGFGLDGVEIISDRKILVQQILGNFVSKALKFTNPGGCVEVCFLIIENEKVVIIVKDNGIGIEKEKLLNIFSGTTNETSVGTSSEIVTGFGLAIVKSFVHELQ